MRIGLLFLLAMLFQIQTAEAAGRRISCRPYVASKMRSICKLTPHQQADLRTELMNYCVGQVDRAVADPAFKMDVEKVSLAMDEVIGNSCPTTTAAAAAAAARAKPASVSAPRADDVEVTDAASAGQ